MTPETLDFLAAANRALANADRVLSIEIPDQAARLAYYAEFHAAQALIFERTGKISKTHKGVDKQFHQVARAELAIPPGLASQLTDAYYYKDVADYGTGDAPPVTMAQARDAIATAEHFVATIRQALAASPPTPAAP